MHMFLFAEFTYIYIYILPLFIYSQCPLSAYSQYDLSCHYIPVREGQAGNFVNPRIGDAIEFQEQTEDTEW